MSVKKPYDRRWIQEKKFSSSNIGTHGVEFILRVRHGAEWKKMDIQLEVVKAPEFKRETQGNNVHYDGCDMQIHIDTSSHYDGTKAGLSSYMVYRDNPSERLFEIALGHENGVKVIRSFVLDSNMVTKILDNVSFAVREWSKKVELLNREFTIIENNKVNIKGDTMKQKRESKQIGSCEASELFLRNIKGIADYWADLKDKTPQERCNGVAFSILVMLDGGNARFPAYTVIPTPHESDREYAIYNDEDYYPDVPEEVQKMGIGGASLHEKFSRTRTE